MIVVILVMVLRGDDDFNAWKDPLEITPSVAWRECKRW